MRFAVIDLGTNTFNLLIGELSPNKKKFTKLFNTKIPVKLGEKSINLGYIADIPFQRGINALLKFKEFIIHYNVQNVFAFATSAIRSANNGDEFVKEAFDKTQITITIIDGNEEAELIYYGNKMAVKMTDDISLIMDIGGGSTEFILASNNTVFWKQSFLLGASRIFEKFNFSNPITRAEEIIFYDYLLIELKPLFEAIKIYYPVELIGSSGAFDSVVDMISEQFNVTQINDLQTEYDINLIQYRAISELIKKSTIEQRQKLKGLIEMRVDMIVISILLIDFVLNEIKINKLRVSTYSLKEGVISKKIGLLT
jgi:exopolyphosphatase/guanosine-5'-triphosphate,3'-diphosphate pyrophosphatase